MIDLQALLEFAARQHPAAVHFPIALVISGALLELLICLHRREDWLIAQRFCLRFGALTGLIAAFLGWSLAEGIEPTGELNLHRWLGVAAGVSSCSPEPSCCVAGSAVVFASRLTASFPSLED